jgi:predicted transcriptional regulator
VNPLPAHRPGQQRAAVRTDARLDETTRAKVDDLAKRFHQPRAAVLCHIMQWGLRRGETLDPVESPGPVRHLYLYVASDLHEQVQKAATAAGVKAAPWLRHMVRQISMTDFPASWQEATPREPSCDSRIYTTRFMLRLDEPSQTTLQQLINQLGASKAAIIRHLIAQATPDDFPTSWQMRAAERHAQQPRQ